MRVEPHAWKIADNSRRIEDLEQKTDASYTAHYVDAIEARIKALETRLGDVVRELEYGKGDE